MPDPLNKWTCPNCYGPKADTEALCAECRNAPKEMPREPVADRDAGDEDEWREGAD